MKPCQVDLRKLVFLMHQMKPCQVDWRKLVFQEKIVLIYDQRSSFSLNRTKISLDHKLSPGQEKFWFYSKKMKTFGHIYEYK